MALVERTELVGGEPVVGRLPGAHPRCLVTEADIRDELEGVAQIGTAPGVHPPGRDGGGEPLVGVLRRAAHGQPVHAGQIHHRTDPAALDVQGVSVGTLLGQHEAAEEADRRLVQHGRAREVSEEAGRGGSLRAHLLGQIGIQRGVAGDRAHVEEDARPEDRFRHGCGHPVGEDFAPLLQAEAAVRVGGHDVAGTRGIARLDEGIADQPRQFGEVLLVRRRGRVIDDQGIVLVGREGLLHACSRAQGHPAIGHRRSAELGLR